MILDRSLDALGGSPTLKFNSLKEIQSLMIDYELLDIWRDRNPTLRQFTWRQLGPAKLRRLDFFLISDSLQCDIKACKFLSPLQSDHSPICWGLHQCKKVNTEEEDTRNLIIH